MLNTWSRAVWLNPLPEEHWTYTPSLHMIRQLFGNRMFPLSPEGLERAMRALSR